MNPKRRLLVPALLLPLLLAAAPVINNRPPRPDEIGYRPADGSTNPLNPPSWIWLHEPGALTYTIQWASRADFGDARTVSGLSLNTYTHSAPLKPGRWHWRYLCMDKTGQASNWSVPRTVVIPKDAVEFPMPTRDEQRARVPEGHPRLFLRPEDLPRLRELAVTTEAMTFQALRTQADLIIDAGPTPEPTQRGSARDKNDKEAVKYWWPNREQTVKAGTEANVLAFLYLITREKQYGDAARKWLLHLASWDPDGPTNFGLNCEAGKPMLYLPARAYDWAYDTLSEEDRATVQAAMRRRGLDAWKSGEIREGVGHLNQPFSSHGNRVWHKLGETGIAFLGDFPEAAIWVDYAVNKFYAAYPVWSDEDGGWHEGVSYWAGYMGKAVTWLQYAKSALAIDGFKKPFFAQVGDFPLYVAPPHSPNIGFGDLSYRPPSTGWGGTMEFFVRGAAGSLASDHAPYWRWWMEANGMKGESGIMGFLYRANLPSLPPAKAPTDLPVSKVFKGIGVASLHTTLLDSRDDVHLLFKSSPFGRQSHGHNPHNTFQLNAYGEELLTTCTYRDLHGSRFHTRWVYSTRAHNAVLVDGEGGRIVTHEFTPDWDYLVGDATDAYGGRLLRYHRHIVFVKPDLILIYDNLVATNAATFQFMLHAPQPFDLNEAGAELTLERSKAGLVARYLSPEALKFRQWDGYEPAPEYREFPTQWHVEAATQTPREELGMLTALVPRRAGQKAEWTAERLESDSAIGIRFVSGENKTIIAIRKAGITGAANLAGRRFEGAVLVRSTD